MDFSEKLLVLHLSLKSFYKSELFAKTSAYFLLFFLEFHYHNFILCRADGLQETNWQEQPGPSSILESRFVAKVFLEVAFESASQVDLLHMGLLSMERQRKGYINILF